MWMGIVMEKEKGERGRGRRWEGGRERRREDKERQQPRSTRSNQPLTPPDSRKTQRMPSKGANTSQFSRCPWPGAVAGDQSPPWLSSFCRLGRLRSTVMR